MGILAIRGGKQPSKARFRFPWPIVDNRDKQNILKALTSPHGWCRLGAKDGQVDAFEKEFAKYHDAKYCLALANGTVAIETILKATGLQPGDEVIVPSITFIATASGVLMAHGIPVFADTLPETCQIDPADIERKITKRTRGIVLVHYAGYPADLDAITKIAKNHKLLLIEDSAHAHGTEWRGRRVGAFGTGGTFSFQGSKSLNCGEGGAVVTDNKKLHEASWAYHHIGRGISALKYAHTSIGPNYRLSELSAAVLRTQLAKLPAQTRKRMKNAAAISKGIADIPGIVPLKEDKRITQRGYYFYVLRFLEEYWGVPRRAFVKAFNAEVNGFSLGTGYGMPVYHIPVFKNYRFDEMGSEVVGRRSYGRTVSYKNPHCPNSDRIAYKEHLTIANNILLNDNACTLIVEVIRKLWNNKNELKGV